MLPVEPLLIFGVVALLVVAIGIASYHFEKKRKLALEAESAALGFRFAPGYSASLAHYRILNTLNGGSNHYGANLTEGTYEGERIQAFDFHYETHSTDSKGNRKTHHHWHYVFALNLPRSFPELTVGRENILTRLAKNFGYPSIDFESHEFSRIFLVKSPDKKFAYDICHARMMEYLLANQDLTFEIDQNIYAMVFPGHRKPGSLQRELDRLVALRRLMPEYLFSAA